MKVYNLFLKIKNKYKIVMNNIYTHLHTSLDILCSWLRDAWQHLTIWSTNTNWLTKWFISYLQSDHFTHALASSCSPFSWLVSKKFQQCLMFSFFMKVTQLVEWSRRLELTYECIHLYPIFHWIWFHRLLMNHKLSQNNVVQNVYHAYDHHWH